MDKGLIPSRYAKALFEVALERNDSEKLYTLMGRLCDAFAAEPALASTVANPFVGECDKEALLRTAAGVEKGQDATFDDFLKLLAQNRRIDIVRDVARAYTDLYRRKNGIFSVDVTSAAPLTEDARKRLETIIKNETGGGTYEYRFSIDPGLIGGFTVTVNNRRLDASVASKLEALRHRLID